MYGKSAVKGIKKDNFTKQKMSAAQRSLSKPIGLIGCYSLDNILLKTYLYRYEISDDGFNSPGKILKVATINKNANKCRTIYGFIWRHLN
jgi:hypothetical protein